MKLLDLSQAKIYFGDKNSDSLEKIRTYFPTIRFVHLKQEHGLQIHQTQWEDGENEVRSGDAHWTMENNLGLLIQTADCIPIFAYHSGLHSEVHPNVPHFAHSEEFFNVPTHYESNDLPESANNSVHIGASGNGFGSAPCILAIHCGWRGVKEKIAPLSLMQLSNRNYLVSDWMIHLGPHIMMDSFEIENFLGIEILKTISEDKNLDFFIQHKRDRMKLNLQRIVIQQLTELGVRRENIFSQEVDTFSNKNFHSFRRDGKQSGRQWSFIYLPLADKCFSLP